MSESNGRRPPKKLSAETKWEIFLQGCLLLSRHRL